MKKLNLIDTERIVFPEETVEKAKKIIKDFNFNIEFNLYNIDELYISTLRLLNQESLKLKNPFSERYDFKTLPAQGKGLSEFQSKASCLMELFERLTIYQIKKEVKVLNCTNLMTGKIEKVEIDLRRLNSKGFAAGNSAEEATLHALIEEIEHLNLWSPQIFGCSPISVVDISSMNLPEWIKNSFVILKFPHFIKNMYFIQALRYPKDPDIDIIEFKKQDDIWKIQTQRNYFNLKNASMSASLNPEKATYRAIMEVLQRGPKEKYSAEKNKIDWDIEKIDDLKSNETDSISGDIQVILDSLDESNKVFVFEVTSEDFKIPVVKIVSDIHKERRGVFANTHLMKKLFKSF